MNRLVKRFLYICCLGAAVSFAQDVEKGMTQDQVLELLGKPSGEMSVGKDVVWLYGSTKLTFRDGIVTATTHYKPATHPVSVPAAPDHQESASPPADAQATTKPSVTNGAGQTLASGKDPPASERRAAERAETFSAGSPFFFWRNSDKPVEMDCLAGGEASLMGRKFTVILEHDVNPAVDAASTPLRIRVVLPGSGVGTAFQVWELDSDRTVVSLAVPYHPLVNPQRFIWTHPVNGVQTQSWHLMNAFYPSGMTLANEVVVYAVADGTRTNPLSNIMRLPLVQVGSP